MGQIVGGAQNVSPPLVGNFHGFLYSIATDTAIQFDDPDAGSVPSNPTIALGISNSGLIVGYFHTNSGPNLGFFKDGTTFTTIQVSSFNTRLLGVNDSQEVIGYYNDGSGHDISFVNVVGSGTFTNIIDPSAVTGALVTTFATGINDNHQIVGYFVDSSGVDHAFLTTYSGGAIGSYTNLSDPFAGTASGQGTFATSINDNSQIAGYYIDSSGVAHGFLYSGGTYVTIDDLSAGTSSGQGTYITGINDSGQISGHFINGSNVDSYFLGAPASTSYTYVAYVAASKPFYPYDTITLADTGANIAALSAATIQQFAANND